MDNRTVRGPQTNGILLVAGPLEPRRPLDIVHPVHPLATHLPLTYLICLIIHVLYIKGNLFYVAMDCSIDCVCLLEGYGLFNDILNTFIYLHSLTGRVRAGLRRCGPQLGTISVGPGSQSTCTKVCRIGRGAQLDGSNWSIWLKLMPVLGRVIHTTFVTRDVKHGK